MRAWRRLTTWLLFAATSAAAGACSSSKGGGGTPVPNIDEFLANIKGNPACALACDPTCGEATAPWKCPALAEWNSIPHDPACGAFDGKATPAVIQGSCRATDPTGDALAKTSAAATAILPDGRRLAPAGNEWVFNEADLPGGFPTSSLLIVGTRWLIVLDGGYDSNAIRVVDTAMLRASAATSPVVSVVKYAPPNGVNYGLAYSLANGVVYASGGVAEAKILAFDFDKSTGKLTPNDALSIPLAAGTLAQALDVSPDGKTLLVSQAKDSHALAFSIDPATYAKPTGTIDLGATDAFAVRFDPNDATSNTAYATLWTSAVDIADASKMRLAQIDLAGQKASTLTVGKSPEEIAFLDARYAVVANALSDTLSVVDRPAAKIVGEVAIPLGAATHGAGPSALAYDPPRKRLYATLSSVNAVAAFDVDLSGAAPALNPAGMIPTGWWPTSVSVDPSDGAVYITNGKGHGSGTDGLPRAFNDGAVAELIRGSVQVVPYMDATALGTATTSVNAENDVGQIAGYSTVECNGAPYDFPVPLKPEDGRSAKIKHVFLVVRENKTFDDIFGDVPGLEGDPKLVMAPGHMDEVWGNARAIGKQFAHMDNYYSDAEQSIQGHAWTVFGRTTDYTERRWLRIWGRGEISFTQSPGVGDNTAPAEGTIFSWLKDGQIPEDNMGELVGGIAYRDLNWPGGSTDATIPDTEGACYIAARARVLCDVKDFTYAWLTNDHAFGLAAGKPNPAVMIATNDEGTGMLLDGLSHSLFWQDSLVIVIEDDPNTGGDHIDLHRSIALFASPWVKRAYVSHAHYDVASVHKLLANLYGKPYRNAMIANAALPLDLFTSTPDYTPYAYLPRAFADISCNPGGTTGSKAAEAWDFSEPDNQPGLGKQNWDALRSLPPHQSAP